MGYLELDPQAAVTTLAGDASLPEGLRAALKGRRSLVGDGRLIDAIADGTQAGVATAMLGAEVELRREGEWAPLGEHFAADGGIAAGDVAAIDGVRLAAIASERSGWAERGRVCAAVRLSLGGGGEVGGCVVALGGVAPYPLRARQVEATLRGRVLGAALIQAAAETARGEAQPVGGGSALDWEAIEAVGELVRALLQHLASDDLPRR